ncbi:hypothetical protein CFIO01_07499 [Colletotrichum fioriniae PJ7]|uniref:Uncharacterized protein n=1 Tax=Colletotrichum fioriniae PJ7 TaxID=1445577 RepID=A0A010R5T9_9PEZI|nr:hypothetical protein CFIO01_07499 [Colletotrichum fioriniae PJ7]
MTKTPILQHRRAASNAPKARRSGGLVKPVDKLSPWGEENSYRLPDLEADWEQYDRYLSASRQQGAKPATDDTGSSRNLPPIKDVDPSAVNAFFASDILSEISKQDPPVAPQPESTSKSKTLPKVSGDAEFYASDALSQLEQESKHGKGN